MQSFHDDHSDCVTDIILIMQAKRILEILGVTGLSQTLLVARLRMAGINLNSNTDIIQEVPPLLRTIYGSQG